MFYSQAQQKSKKSEEIPLFYRKRPEFRNLDCGRVLQGDESYTSCYTENRKVLRPSDDGYTREHIRCRVLPPMPMKKIDFGVAHVRIVYKDYDFIEDELRSSFHPQNFFCYVLDVKANESFRRKIRHLPTCFSNVYVIKEEFNITSSGLFMNIAHFKCMQLLVKHKGWGYMILLQNHDVIIKTPYEMVEIYNLLGGANDIEVVPHRTHEWENASRWDSQTLHLFTNESTATESQLNATLRIHKGRVQASLSRAAVEWMVNTINLTTLIKEINSRPATDEYWIPSLHLTDELDMPGRFSYNCFAHLGILRSISRLTFWSFDGKPQCNTGYYRHMICIFGIEDVPMLSKYPHLMANKMLPDFDYAAIECVHELLFNRTFLNQIDTSFNTSYYLNMPNDSIENLQQSYFLFGKFWWYNVIVKPTNIKYICDEREDKQECRATTPATSEASETMQQ